MSAGPKFEYLWKDDKKHKKGSKLPAPEYIELALNWMNEQIQDPTLQSGDVVVTEERAKQMSQPKVDAQGRPIKLEIPPRPAKPDPNAAKPPDGKDDDEPVKVTRDPNRPVRQVGPNFIAR